MRLGVNLRPFIFLNPILATIFCIKTLSWDESLRYFIQQPTCFISSRGTKKWKFGRAQSPSYGTWSESKAIYFLKPHIGYNNSYKTFDLTSVLQVLYLVPYRTWFPWNHHFGFNQTQRYGTWNKYEHIYFLKPHILSMFWFRVFWL